MGVSHFSPVNIVNIMSSARENNVKIKQHLLINYVDIGGSKIPTNLTAWLINVPILGVSCRTYKSNLV